MRRSGFVSGLVSRSAREWIALGWLNHRRRSGSSGMVEPRVRALVWKTVSFGI